MKATWWLTDNSLHLRVNDCLETNIALREAIDASCRSYAYDFALWDLVMDKIKPLVWLSMPGHE